MLKSKNIIWCILAGVNVYYSVECLESIADCFTFAPLGFSYSLGERANKFWFRCFVLTGSMNVMKGFILFIFSIYYLFFRQKKRVKGLNHCWEVEALAFTKNLSYRRKFELSKRSIHVTYNVYCLRAVIYIFNSALSHFSVLLYIHIKVSMICILQKISSKA